MGKFSKTRSIFLCCYSASTRDSLLTWLPNSFTHVCIHARLPCFPKLLIVGFFVASHQELVFDIVASLEILALDPKHSRDRIDWRDQTQQPSHACPNRVRSRWHVLWHSNALGRCPDHAEVESQICTYVKFRAQICSDVRVAAGTCVRSRFCICFSTSVSNLNSNFILKLNLVWHLNQVRNRTWSLRRVWAKNFDLNPCLHQC